ncbi:MAG: glycosyltransferase family 1 protein [Bacteroidetes bacterium]|nr:MAG: glycosyltransferase family 1 protein [Bacteroidota bacterium]
MALTTLLKGQLRFMNQYFDVLAVSSGGGTFDDVAKHEGVKTQALTMSRTITPFKDLKSLFLLYKLFKKEKPFIVHTHTPKAGTLGMIAAKLAGVPHRLHTIAGLPLLITTGPKRLLLNIVEKITYACASKIYPNSFAMKDIIIKNKFTKESKLKVIEKGSTNGVDTSHFDPNLFDEASKIKLQNELAINKEDTVFVFIGRIVKDKGMNELMHTFAKLNLDYPNTKLLLVGPFEDHLNPLLPETYDLIKNHESIIHVGYQKDVRPYFAISDILAFPSYREGFPNVVMQAGSMGLVSIVTDINGCNEIIENGMNGLIIPPKNENALFEAMKYMINHPEERNNMANSSRSKIVKNYQQKIVWNALLNEYQNLN